MKMSCFLLLFSKVIICYAQQLPTAFDKSGSATIQPFHKNALLVLKADSQPDITAYRFVEKKIYYSDYGALNPNNIENIFIPDRDSAIKLYGNDAANGAVIYYLKHKILNSFITLNELLIKFKISDADKLLPVLIDSNMAYRPEKIYFDIRHIKSVTIERETTYGKRFIDIITYDPPPKPLPGELYIRGSILNKRLN